MLKPLILLLTSLFIVFCGDTNQAGISTTTNNGTIAVELVEENSSDSIPDTVQKTAYLFKSSGNQSTESIFIDSVTINNLTEIIFDSLEAGNYSININYGNKNIAEKSHIEVFDGNTTNVTIIINITIEIYYTIINNYDTPSSAQTLNVSSNNNDEIVSINPEADSLSDTTYFSTELIDSITPSSGYHTYFEYPDIASLELHGEPISTGILLTSHIDNRNPSQIQETHFSLNDQWKTFEVTLGILSDDTPTITAYPFKTAYHLYAATTFTIVTNNNDTIYQSPTMRFLSWPITLKVNIKNAHSLTLITHNQSTTTWMNAIWGNIKFIVNDSTFTHTKERYTTIQDTSTATDSYEILSQSVVTYGDNDSDLPWTTTSIYTTDETAYIIRGNSNSNSIDISGFNSGQNQILSISEYNNVSEDSLHISPWTYLQTFTNNDTHYLFLYNDTTGSAHFYTLKNGYISELKFLIIFDTKLTSFAFYTDNERKFIAALKPQSLYVRYIELPLGNSSSNSFERLSLPYYPLIRDLRWNKINLGHINKQEVLILSPPNLEETQFLESGSQFLGSAIQIIGISNEILSTYTCYDYFEFENTNAAETPKSNYPLTIKMIPIGLNTYVFAFSKTPYISATYKLKHDPRETCSSWISTPDLSYTKWNMYNDLFNLPPEDKSWTHFESFQLDDVSYMYVLAAETGRYLLLENSIDTFIIQ
ncbi:MAG: NPCBM/NEW2 domain-containing protein [Fibrobacterales bacterium]